MQTEEKKLWSFIVHSPIRKTSVMYKQTGLFLWALPLMDKRLCLMDYTDVLRRLARWST